MNRKDSEIWRQHEDEQRRREKSMTLEEKLAWQDDMLRMAVMLGYKLPSRPDWFRGSPSSLVKPT